MTFIEAGYRLLKEFEGCSLTPYQDAGGLWTIGYGHCTGKSPGAPLTDSQAADSLLASDVAEIAKEVTDALKFTVNDNQFSALVCFTFNLGIANLLESTLLRCINSGHAVDCADEFLRWIKINGIPNDGLLRRRQAERALYLTPTT